MLNHKLSEEDVRKVAKLAKLELTDEEVTKFRGQLSEVLDYFKILDEVNVAEVEPTSQVTGLENRFRKDAAQAYLTQDEAISNAASSQDNLFKTKAIF